MAKMVRFKGVAWFEKEIAAEEKAAELCFVPDKPDPNLDDLVHICKTFFGNEYGSFAQADSISVRLYNLPGEHSTRRVYLVPFHKAEKHWDGYSRPAALLSIYPSNKQESFQLLLHSKNRVMLELCKRYPTDTQSRNSLVDAIERRIADAKQLTTLWTRPT